MKCGYVYGLERISQKRILNSSFLIHHYVSDGQGSIRSLADASGNVTDTYYYTAFGEELAKSGTTENEFRYVGEQWDPNAGFYYLRARWMDPSTGRFVSVDPYDGDPQAPVSLYRYLYANASPITMIDPSGALTLTEVSVAQSLLLSLFVYNILRSANPELSLPETEQEDGLTYRLRRLLPKNVLVYVPEGLDPKTFSALFVLAQNEHPRDGDLFGLVAGASSPGLSSAMELKAKLYQCHIANAKRTGQHAEEAILDYTKSKSWKLLSIGTTIYPCDGITYPGHNCGKLLDDNGVSYNNDLLLGIAEEIKFSDKAGRYRTTGVGFFKKNKYMQAGF